MFQPPFVSPHMPQSWFGGRAHPGGPGPVGSQLPPSFTGNHPGLPPMSANAFLPLASRPENVAASSAWMTAHPPTPQGSAAGGIGGAMSSLGGSSATPGGGAMPGMPGAGAAATPGSYASPFGPATR